MELSNPESTLWQLIFRNHLPVSLVRTGVLAKDSIVQQKISPDDMNHAPKTDYYLKKNPGVFRTCFKTS